MKISGFNCLDQWVSRLVLVASAGFTTADRSTCFPAVDVEPVSFVQRCLYDDGASCLRNAKWTRDCWMIIHQACEDLLPLSSLL
jgi:hypothetical protein